MPVASSYVVRAFTLALVSAVAAAQDAPPPAADAPRALYLKHCSACHGNEGKGDGPQKVFPPARNFQQGGFSFGNTEEALFRTISSGIPGTPMVPFKDQLAPAERRQIAAYVLTLVPAEARAPARDSRVVITDRAAFLRGSLPPPGPGSPNLACGLSLGLPGGFGFFWRTDEVRLFEVRRGPFVDRSDWSGRGGTPLEPLGEVFHALGREGAAPYWRETGGSFVPLRAALAGTLVRGARGSVFQRLGDASGAAVARLEEAPRVDTLRNAIGYSRDLVFSEAAPGTTVAVMLPDPEPESVPRLGFPASDAPEPLDAEGGASPQRWVVSVRKQGGFEGIHLQGNPGARLVRIGSGLALAVPLGEGAVTIRVSYVRTANVDDDVLAELSRDLM